MPSKQIKFGADPEFIVGHKDVFSNSIFTPAFRAVTNGTGGRIGTDGNCDVGELRPDCSTSSIGVVANLALLIKAMKDSFTTNNIEILAGHYKFGQPIGGHIHMSGFAMDMAEVSNCCDYFIGGLSNLIDDKEEKKLRMKSGYGKGYREQGSNWMEYRAPGSWLLHPKVALGNLMMAEYVVFLYEKFREDKPDKTANLSNINTAHKFTGKMEIKQIVDSLSTSCSKFTNKKLFAQVLTDLENNLPINWNTNILENWL